MSSNRFEAQMRAEAEYQQMPKTGRAIGVPQCTEPTLTSLANDLADALVSLRAGITNLRSELSAVCFARDSNQQTAAQTAPVHSLSALCQLQGLIEHTRGAVQDVQDMRDGLRV